jgi:hypothetical protein
MYIKRLSETLLHQAIASGKATLVLGARQVGKNYCYGEPVDQQSGDSVSRLQPTADGQYATLCLCA